MKDCNLNVVILAYIIVLLMYESIHVNYTIIYLYIIPFYLYIFEYKYLEAIYSSIGVLQECDYK